MGEATSDDPLFSAIAEEARKGSVLLAQLLAQLEAPARQPGAVELRALARRCDDILVRIRALEAAAARHRGAKLARRTSLIPPVPIRPSTIS